MKFPLSLILCLPLLASSYPIILEHMDIPNHRIQIHEDPVHALHPRDSITIDIKNSFSNTSVRNTHNNAKLEIVKNTKNANIAMGDHSNHIADFHSFGDQNMRDSTGGNTGGWNTKNQGMKLTTGQNEKRSDKQKKAVPEARENHKKVRGYRNMGVRQTEDGYRFDGYMPSTPGAQRLEDAEDCEPGSYSYLAEQCVPTPRRKSKYKSNSTDSALSKIDRVNLNLGGGNAKDINLTRSENGNIVEVYIARGGDNVVDITVSFEGDNSILEDSNSNSAVKF